MIVSFLFNLISLIGLHTGYIKTVLGSARNKQTNKMTMTFAHCKKVLNCSQSRKKRIFVAISRTQKLKMSDITKKINGFL